MDFLSVCERITPPSQEAMREARKRWSEVAKPLHSLGLLEDLVTQMAGANGAASFTISPKAVLQFCADNGVVAEGVTQTGPEVTAIVAENFLKGKTSAAVMARYASATLLPADIGMARDTLVRRDYKVRYGTWDMARGPAMKREEAILAVEAGISLAMEAVEAGYRLLALGEMGIGNTTTSSAVSSVLLGESVEEMVGRGAGLSGEGLARKKEVVKRSIEVNSPNPEDVLDVLSKVGGLDLAALCGACLGAAYLHVPVVLDGFISLVGALCAVRLCPQVEGYLLPSHISEEPGAKRVLKSLGKEALLHGGFFLGEGTGAIALFPLLDMGLAVYNQMASFSDISVEAYEDYGEE